MHRTSVGSHSFGDSVRIEDGSSSSFTFPFVGITRCRVRMFLQSTIRAEFSNALQSLAHLGRKCGKLVT